MKKAKYHECVRYCWDCPECDHYNEDTEDPAYQETVFCEECGQEFEPEEE